MKTFATPRLRARFLTLFLVLTTLLLLAACGGQSQPAAEAPAAEAPKRPRRSRAKAAEPAQEPMIDADAATSEPAAADEPAPKTTRKRRSTRKAEPVEPTEPVAEPTPDDGEVAASLAELAQSERPRGRRGGLAESFGLDQEATPDQVLNSLAARIGGTLVEDAEEVEVDEEAEASEVDEETDASTADEETEEEPAEGDEAAAEGDESAPRRRRRRRGGRRRRRGSGDGAADGESDGEEADDTESAEPEAGAESGEEKAAETSTSRRRRRRRRRGEDSADGEEDGVDVVVRVREPRRRSNVSDEVTGIEGSTRMEAKKQRRREGRAAGRRRAPILSESEFLARREAVERTMLIRQAEDYSQIAVMEDGVLVEHYVDRASATSMIGNIYLGRVQNVLPSMEAAFVDIGRGRNAVLYAGEVDWDSFGVTGSDKKVERVFKSGQQVLVQVSKDPVGAKGARLTSHISIPGRYIVYSPGGHLSGISRKLPEGERKRLKGILDELIGPEASVIVRTAAEGASEDELVRDVNRLKAQWEVLEKKSKNGQAPQLLYAEPDLTVRIVRDLFTEDFGALVVDGNGSADDAHDTVQAYVQHVAPHLAERLQRWDRSEKGDIFDAHRVHEQVAKALERKVFLPSGGSLIIDRTEAMTVIDVNTGKFTGNSGNLEATVTSNNLEAAEEIVRQLRLRDIGGIIVIDFIDMVLPANRELLLRRLVESLGRDRTRHQVAEVTSLGLVQMTRKKIGTGLAEAFTVACETCKGRGYHVHDAPVASQAPADGGEREGGRRGRGGSQTTRRGSRAKKEEPVKPAGPSPLKMIAQATEHAHAVEAAAAEAAEAAEAAAEGAEVAAEPVEVVAESPEAPAGPIAESEATPTVGELTAPEPVAELAPPEEPVVVEAEVVEEPAPAEA
ncbi:MAG: Rne/Rng family ribonuclease [Propionibacteriaceae bacterium]|nr:Rne/Rng family ribonuclease [Propionibacteriaceae bacterium]